MGDLRNIEAARQAAKETLGQGSPTGGTGEMDTIRAALAQLNKGLPQAIIDGVRPRGKTISRTPDVERAVKRLEVVGSEIAQDKHELVTRALQNLSTPDVSVPLFQEIQALRRIVLDANVITWDSDAATVAYGEALNNIYQTVRIDDGRGKPTQQQAKAVQPPPPPR